VAEECLWRMLLRPTERTSSARLRSSSFNHLYTVLYVMVLSSEILVPCQLTRHAFAFNRGCFLHQSLKVSGSLNFLKPFQRFLTKSCGVSSDLAGRGYQARCTATWRIRFMGRLGPKASTRLNTY
jgi:hypothetical protein